MKSPKFREIIYLLLAGLNDLPTPDTSIPKATSKIEVPKITVPMALILGLT